MIARPEGGVEQRAIVIALGGNALIPAGERGEIHQQFAHARESLEPIVALAREGWRIAIVHGNGPQIGDELLRNEMARERTPPLPLGVLVAATAGWIGYMIQQSLKNALLQVGVRRDVVTLVTQVLVDSEDPGTSEPVKPIGRGMPEERARRLASDLGWSVAPQGDTWRRLVPSPRPLAIVESSQIRDLVHGGTIVIAAGGGGTPVCRKADFGYDGVDAVVDKDRAATVLARDIRAAVLLILTDVEGAYVDYGGPGQRLLDRLTVDEAEALLGAGEFGRGSMAPKVEAAIEFVRTGGERAHIARLNQGLPAVLGRAGTTILAGSRLPGAEVGGGQDGSR